MLGHGWPRVSTEPLADAPRGSMGSAGQAHPHTQVIEGCAFRSTSHRSYLQQGEEGT